MKNSEYLIDSHCHLDLLDYSQGDTIAEVIARAQAVGVKKFLCVCVRLEKFNDMQTLCAPYENVWLSIGSHPNEQTTSNFSTERLIALAQNPKVIAFGETGLDYYRSEESERAAQQENFHCHIIAANTLKKPLIIHSRAAKKDTLDLLKKYKSPEVGAVLHCFTEDWEMAKEALEMGLYISLSGIVTFKNATDLQEVAKKIPLQRLLIETDAPYLAPVPMRGKQNEPSYVYHVAKFLAALRGESFEQLANATTENFQRLFMSS